MTIETFNNYGQATARLKGKDRVRIGYATELVKGESNSVVAIAHHGSGIVFLADDTMDPELQFQFTMAGWDSNTTRDRISACLSARFVRGVALSRVKGQTMLSVRTQGTDNVHYLEIDPYGTYSLVREEFEGYEVIRVTAWDYRGKRTYRMRVW